MKVNMFRKHVSHQLTAYCHKELSETEMENVKNHVSVCPKCESEYKEIQFGIQLASQLQVRPAPDHLWNSLQKHFESSGKQRRRALFPTLVYVGVGMLVVLIAGGVMLRSQFYSREATPTTGMGWDVQATQGVPRVEGRKILKYGKLGVGEWLETDNDSAVKVNVAEIGEIDLNPNSRLQLIQSQSTEHRISLAKGKLSAFILAPPRLFVVETPSATAIDLGCAYTLEVDEEGTSLLHVTSGWVSLFRGGRETVIPAGAICASRKGVGVGTPYDERATESVRRALEVLDFGKEEEKASALGTLLAEASKSDALSLWHMLEKGERWQTESDRGRIYDLLKRFVPAPTSVTRDGVIRGDRSMLEQWRDQILR